MGEAGLTRSARLYFPAATTALTLHSATSQWVGMGLPSLFSSPGAVSVEVHLLVIHFLKNISAKALPGGPLAMVNVCKG